jgi:hypothetical protein
MATLKLKDLLKETIDDAEAKELENAMGSGFKGLEAALKSMEDEAREEVEQVDESILEGRLDEKGQLKEEVTTLAIVGIILAAPKLIELITKGISKLIRVFKKVMGKGDGKEDPAGTAAKIIEFTHKWHKSYIKALRWILKITGVFKKAKITDDKAQMKAATLLYYTIIAGMAVYSGVGAVHAFKSAVASAGSGAGGFSLSALEAGMAAIKSGEVAEFIGELGLAGTAST